MVLCKRKPVQYLPHLEPHTENEEVWCIKQTGEIFDNYEDYLDRIDVYYRREYTCQISGHSHLTFFEAYESERTGAQEIEEAFPEPLKEPVLRRVQFSTVSRIDHLVDKLYDEFKRDYFPGEAVLVTLDEEDRIPATVREKTHIGERRLADGTMKPASTRYFVTLDDDSGDVALVEDDHITRERKIFTKAILRSFIKNTVNREPWSGAPWLVRHDVAVAYKIETRIPAHLRWDYVQAERKQVAAEKRHAQYHNASGVNGANGTAILPKMGKKGKEPDEPPPPPPPKYPIEDLQLDMKPMVRPTLKWMSRDVPAGMQTEDGSKDDETIEMKSVGLLLEAWDTLNVYCEIFHLDSFTFDDFVQAMRIASPEMPCQILSEAHCSVLKVLVHSDKEGGKVQFWLPELETESAEDEEQEEAEEEEADASIQSEEAEPSKKGGRATRSSLAKVEADKLAAEVAAAEKAEAEAASMPKHRAEEALAEFDWIDRLRKRDLADGGWEMIMVGLLHQLSSIKRQQAICEELLIQIVPPETEPTRENIRYNFWAMDVNYRIQALQIICLLTTETKAVRKYMEDCSDQMTASRKDKIDWQRQRKQALEELRPLHEERKILLPDNMPPSPPLEPDEANGEIAASDAEELTPPAEDESQQDSEDDLPRGRSLRHAQDRAAERQKAKEKADAKKAAKAEAAKVPKQSKQFLKLLKEIDKKEDFIRKCEEEISVIENDLREADCPRTRVLGKDRFWNRYYWFERNGMPFAGLPQSSTAQAGYANGCIWVQGPDDIEREGYINLDPTLQDEYKLKFKMTVPERKAREEGKTHVYNAKQWGYIDEPDDLDKLIDWLDHRGFNELKLRKELLNYREKITTNMENRKAYLGIADKQANGHDNGEEEDSPDEEPVKRTSTRNKAVAASKPQHRCLKWQNLTAINELGHLHSEKPPPPPEKLGPRSKKATRKYVEVAEDDFDEEEEEEPPKKTRRRGKRKLYG